MQRYSYTWAKFLFIARAKFLFIFLFISYYCLYSIYLLSSSLLETDVIVASSKFTIWTTENSPGC